ncbi:hypothetical protein ACFLTP_04335 [Chloroflexota bacterium]
MGKYKELFKFAAKAGALEGYLYERVKLEQLDNWVINIERMYISLPNRMKDDIRDEVATVLTKTLTYGGGVFWRNQ